MKFNKILSLALTITFILSALSALSFTHSSPNGNVTPPSEPAEKALAQTTPGRAYSNASLSVDIDITRYDDRLIYQNRIIYVGGVYLGPVDVMTKCANGDYLGFIRFAFSHVGTAGDLELYRSVDNAITWEDEGCLKSVVNMDTRNYACGVSSTGRVFIFYSVYDYTNGTWPTMIEYRYSDDNGTTWSVPVNMSIPTLDSLVPLSGCTWGYLRVYGDSRIGFFYFVDNETTFALNLTQTRFCYSDDDGVNWHHVIMGANTPDPNVRTETDSVYLGDNQIVALSRMEAGAGPEMFTSSNNGLTWAAKGVVTTVLPPGQGAYMSVFKDVCGEYWVLVFLYQGIAIHYSVAYGDDLMSLGVSAWSAVVDTSIISGGFPFTLIDPDTGVGFIMTEIEESPTVEFVLIWNLTASVSLTRFVDIVSAPVAFEIVHTEGMASCSYNDTTFIVSTDLGGLFINMTVWNPGMTQTDEAVAEWTANSTNSNAAVTYTLSGLQSGTQYSVYVDDSVLGAPILTGDSGEISFTYSGPWSGHAFMVDISEFQMLMSMLWPLVSIAIIFMVLSGLFGIIIGTGTNRKK